MSSQGARGVDSRGHKSLALGLYTESLPRHLGNLAGNYIYVAYTLATHSHPTAPDTVIKLCMSLMSHMIKVSFGTTV